MGIPHESSIFCSKCSVFNIEDHCCICDTCREAVIDKFWIDCRDSKTIVYNSALGDRIKKLKTDFKEGKK